MARSTGASRKDESVRQPDCVQLRGACCWAPGHSVDSLHPTPTVLGPKMVEVLLPDFEKPTVK